MRHRTDASPAPVPAARTSRGAPVRLGTPDAGTAVAVLARAAGNRAVGGLLRSLQRQPVDYTKEQKDVESTKMTRFEVRDLAFGIRGGFQDRYGKNDDDVSDESNKTSESPNRMAVVVMPDKLDPDKPVQIILHFHGWGFRWNSSAHDPYAGYLVSRGRGGRPAAGTVRDVHQEHWEQQLSASQGKGAQVMAILAQGIGKSQFGSFPTYEYVRDVLMKSGKSELVSLAGKANYSVVLSAHSGGGSRVAGSILAGNDEAETADRGALRPQTPDEAQKRVVNQLQPVELVVLYEAINGENDRNNVMDWVDRQLGRLGTALTKTPDKAKDALAATPVFRGYYGKRSGSSYTWPYEALACDIELSIQENIPAQFQDDARDHFRVIRVAGPKGEDVGHERVISGIDADPKTGSLADALNAQRDPKSDRSRAVGCGDLGPARARRKKRSKK